MRSANVSDIRAHRIAHLWEGKNEKGQAESTEPEHLPERPSPAVGLDSEARHDRGESGCSTCRETVQTHGIGQGVWREDVAKRRACTGSARLLQQRK